MEFMVSVRFCEPIRSQGSAQDAENRMSGGVAEVAGEIRHPGLRLVYATLTQQMQLKMPIHLDDA